MASFADADITLTKALERSEFYRQRYASQITRIEAADNLATAAAELLDTLRDPEQTVSVNALLAAMEAYSDARIWGQTETTIPVCQDCGMCHEPGDKSSCIEGHGDDPIHGRDCPITQTSDPMSCICDDEPAPYRGQIGTGF